MVCLNSSLSIFIVTVVVTLSTGCFITNCPPGGKRSGVSEVKIRQCEQCGPPGSSGRCYGPSICCSPEFGCLIATPETFSCLIENRFTTLCQNPGGSCSGQNGDINNGQCGADGVCCNSETCSVDDSCHDDNVGVSNGNGNNNNLVGKENGGTQMVKSGKFYHHRYPLDIVFHHLINGQQNQNSHRRLPSSSNSNLNSNSNSQQSAASSSSSLGSSATDY